MMIEERLEIGTKIYYVNEDNNVFQRKKLFKIDNNGDGWFRYDRPLRTHKMEEHTIVGYVFKDVEGRVPSMESHLDEYYLDNGVMVDQLEIEDSDSWGGYFLDKEEALQWIEERKAEMERIEHS